MGEGLLLLYKNKCKKSWKLAFFSVIIIGFCIHAYKLLNTLPNHDSVFNYYSDQNMLSSGRWFLTIACSISSYFDLPWINGLLSLFYIGLAMAIIVEIFELSKPVPIILCSALFVSFPSVTTAFFFNFTADGYMFSMLLATVAVLIQKKYFVNNKKAILPSLLTVAFLCFSCGIYQAYIPYALVLTVCLFILEIFKNEKKTKDLWIWTGRQLAIYATAIAAYYIIWKICLFCQNTAPSTYKGISDISNFSLANIFSGFIKSVKAIVLFFIQNNILEHGISLYSVLNLLFVFVLATCIVLSTIKHNIHKNPSRLILLLISLFVIVPSVGLWSFASPSLQYYPLMLQSLSILYLLSVVLADSSFSKKAASLFGLFMVVIVLNFSIMANISYYFMHESYERSYYEGLEMTMRIHELDTPYKKVAILGDRSDEVALVKENYSYRSAMNIHILSSQIEKSLLYDSIHTYAFLHNVFDLDLPLCTDSELELFEKSPVVSEMATWPSKDSVKVIDDILVIKLSQAGTQDNVK